MQTKLTLAVDSENQFSEFLLNHLKPIRMNSDWGLSLRINYYLQPFLQTIDFAIRLGELEHTGDWDPSIIIHYWDQNQELQRIETDCGYYIMDIQNENLLLEDAPGRGQQEDEDISYHVIHIQTIHSISIVTN